MKFIITKREHNASAKFLKEVCTRIRPLIAEYGTSAQKELAKLDTLLATPMLWNDIVNSVKEPIIIDADGSAIYISDDTIVIDVPEVVTLKQLAVSMQVVEFMSAIAKPLIAVINVIGSLKSVYDAASKHYKAAVKAVDNYSVMEFHELEKIALQRDPAMDTTIVTKRELADLLRAMDRLEAMRIASADKAARLAAAELAAFEHDSKKADTVEHL